MVDLVEQKEDFTKGCYCELVADPQECKDAGYCILDYAKRINTELRTYDAHEKKE